MRARASKALGANIQLEKQLRVELAGLEELVEAERKRMREAGDKAAVAIIMKAATDSVQKGEEEIEKATSKAEALLATKFESQADPLKAIETTVKDLEELIKSTNETLEKVIKPKIDEIPATAQGPFVEARRSLFN